MSIKAINNQEQKEARLIDITKHHAFVLVYQTPNGDAFKILSNIIPPDRADDSENIVRSFLLDALIASKNGFSADGVNCTKCQNAPLVFWKKGESHQTENGFFVTKIDGWYCPKCGGGYGGAK